MLCFTQQIMHGGNIMKNKLETLLGEVNDLLIDTDNVIKTLTDLEHMKEAECDFENKYLSICRIVFESYKWKFEKIKSQLDLLIFECFDCADAEIPIVFRVEKSPLT